MPLDPRNRFDPYYEAPEKVTHLGSAVDAMQSNMYRGAEAFARVAKQRQLEEAFRKRADDNLRESQKYTPYGAQGIEDINDVNSGLTYLKNLAVNQIPQYGTMLGAGLAGTAVAGPVGGVIAAALSTAPQHAGEIYNQQQEKGQWNPNALMAGTAGNTGLDLLPAGAMAKIMGLGGKGSLAKAVTRGALAEGPVEGAQKVVTDLSSGVTPNMSPEYLLDTANEVVAGAIMGGGIGGAGHVAGRVGDARNYMYDSINKIPNAVEDGADGVTNSIKRGMGFDDSYQEGATPNYDIYEDAQTSDKVRNTVPNYNIDQETKGPVSGSSAILSKPAVKDQLAKNGWIYREQQEWLDANYSPEEQANILNVGEGRDNTEIQDGELQVENQLDQMALDFARSLETVKRNKSDEAKLNANIMASNLDKMLESVYPNATLAAKQEYFNEKLDEYQLGLAISDTNKGVGIPDVAEIGETKDNFYADTLAQELFDIGMTKEEAGFWISDDRKLDDKQKKRVFARVAKMHENKEQAERPEIPEGQEATVADELGTPRIEGTEQQGSVREQKPLGTVTSPEEDINKVVAFARGQNVAEADVPGLVNKMTHLSDRQKEIAVKRIVDENVASLTPETLPISLNTTELNGLAQSILDENITNTDIEYVNTLDEKSQAYIEKVVSKVLRDQANIDEFQDDKKGEILQRINSGDNELGNLAKAIVDNTTTPSQLKLYKKLNEKAKDIVTEYVGILREDRALEKLDNKRPTDELLKGTDTGRVEIRGFDEEGVQNYSNLKEGEKPLSTKTPTSDKLLDEVATYGGNLRNISDLNDLATDIIDGIDPTIKYELNAREREYVSTAVDMKIENKNEYENLRNQGIPEEELNSLLYFSREQEQKLLEGVGESVEDPYSKDASGEATDVDVGESQYKDRIDPDTKRKETADLQLQDDTDYETKYLRTGARKDTGERWDDDEYLINVPKIAAYRGKDHKKDYTATDDYLKVLNKSNKRSFKAMPLLEAITIEEENKNRNRSTNKEKYKASDSTLSRFVDKSTGKPTEVELTRGQIQGWQELPEGVIKQTKVVGDVLVTPERRLRKRIIETADDIMANIKGKGVKKIVDSETGETTKINTKLYDAIESMYKGFDKTDSNADIAPLEQMLDLFDSIAVTPKDNTIISGYEFDALDMEKIERDYVEDEDFKIGTSDVDKGFIPLLNPKGRKKQNRRGKQLDVIKAVKMRIMDIEESNTSKKAKDVKVEAVASVLAEYMERIDITRLEQDKVYSRIIKDAKTDKQKLEALFSTVGVTENWKYAKKSEEESIDVINNPTNDVEHVVKYILNHKIPVNKAKEHIDKISGISNEQKKIALQRIIEIKDKEEGWTPSKKYLERDSGGKVLASSEEQADKSELANIDVKEATLDARLSILLDRGDYVKNPPEQVHDKSGKPVESKRQFKDRKVFYRPWDWVETFTWEYIDKNNPSNGKQKEYYYGYDKKDKRIFSEEEWTDQASIQGKINAIANSGNKKLIAKLTQEQAEWVEWSKEGVTAAREETNADIEVIKLRKTWLEKERKNLQASEAEVARDRKRKNIAKDNLPMNQPGYDPRDEAVYNIEKGVWENSNASKAEVYEYPSDGVTYNAESKKWIKNNGTEEQLFLELTNKKVPNGTYYDAESNQFFTEDNKKVDLKFEELSQFFMNDGNIDMTTTEFADNGADAEQTDVANSQDWLTTQDENYAMGKGSRKNSVENKYNRTKELSLREKAKEELSKTNPKIITDARNAKKTLDILKLNQTNLYDTAMSKYVAEKHPNVTDETEISELTKKYKNAFEAENNSMITGLNDSVERAEEAFAKTVVIGRAAVEEIMIKDDWYRKEVSSSKPALSKEPEDVGSNMKAPAKPKNIVEDTSKLKTSIPAKNVTRTINYENVTLPDFRINDKVIISKPVKNKTITTKDGVVVSNTDTLITKKEDGFSEFANARGITSVGKTKITKYPLGKKANGLRKELQSKYKGNENITDLINNGDKTAFTVVRGNEMAVGATFSIKGVNTPLRVTKLHEINPSKFTNTQIAEWSKREGWSPKSFKDFLYDEDSDIEKGAALKDNTVQVEFERVLDKLPSVSNVVKESAETKKAKELKTYNDYSYAINEIKKSITRNKRDTDINEKTTQDERKSDLIVDGYIEYLEKNKLKLNQELKNLHTKYKSLQKERSALTKHTRNFPMFLSPSKWKPLRNDVPQVKTIKELLPTGHRTATTTRDANKLLNVGDTFTVNKIPGVYKVTEVRKLTNVSPDEWSRLEGWSPNMFKEYGSVNRNASQMIFERIDNKKTEFNKLPSYKKGQANMVYTGVGSRKTPLVIQKRMAKVAKYLESLGYTLRSGSYSNGKSVPGADTAFQNGVVNKDNMEIFSSNDATDQTRHIAIEIHGAPDRIAGNKLAMDLMARNTNQVFGANLDKPSDFEIAWTPDGITQDKDRTIITGGTGQAISMADLKGIPVINMNNDNWEQDLLKLLPLKPKPESKTESKPESKPESKTESKPESKTKIATIEDKDIAFTKLDAKTLKKFRALYKKMNEAYEEASDLASELRAKSMDADTPDSPYRDGMMGDSNAKSQEAGNLLPYLKAIRIAVGTNNSDMMGIKQRLDADKLTEAEKKAIDSPVLQYEFDYDEKSEKFYKEYDETKYSIDPIEEAEKVESSFTVWQKRFYDDEYINEPVLAARIAEGAKKWNVDLDELIDKDVKESFKAAVNVGNAIIKDAEEMLADKLDADKKYTIGDTIHIVSQSSKYKVAMVKDWIDKPKSKSKSEPDSNPKSEPDSNPKPTYTSQLPISGVSGTDYINADFKDKVNSMTVTQLTKQLNDRYKRLATHMNNPKVSANIRAEIKLLENKLEAKPGAKPKPGTSTVTVSDAISQVFKDSDARNLVKETQATVDKLLANTGVKVKVVDGKEALDVAEKMGIEDAKIGMYYGTLQGFAYREPGTNGEYSVYINPAVQGKLRDEVIRHEIGHSIMYGSNFNKNSKEAAAIMDEFNTWLKAKGKDVDSIYELIKSKKTPEAALSYIQSYIGDNRTAKLKELPVELKNYLLDFDEWFADQAAKALSRNTPARTTVQKFFDKIVKALRKLFGKPAQASKYVNNEVGKFIDRLRENPTGEYIRNDAQYAGLSATFNTNINKKGTLESALDTLKNVMLDKDYNLRQLGKGKIPAFKKLADLMFKPRGNTKKDDSYWHNKLLSIAKYESRGLEIMRGASKELQDKIINELYNEERSDAFVNSRTVKLRSLFKDLSSYMKKAGIPVNNRKNYFPEIANVEYTESHHDEFVDMMTKYPKAMKGIAKKWNDDTDKRNKYMHHTTKQTEYISAADVPQLMYENIVRSDVMDEASQESQQTPHVRFLKHRLVNFLQGPDLKNWKTNYLQTSVTDAVTTYVVQAVKRAEYETRFGKLTDSEQQNYVHDLMAAGGKKFSDYTTSEIRNFEFNARRTNKLEIMYDEAKEQGASFEDIQKARNYVAAEMGTHGRDTAYWLNEKLGIPMPQSHAPINTKLQTATSTLMSVANIMVLGLSTITSMLDPIGIAVRNGNFNQTMKSVYAGLKETVSKDKGELEILAEAVGAISDAATKEALAHGYNMVNMTPTVRKMNDKFFKLIGLEQWTKMTRVMAVDAAQGFIARHDKANPNSKPNKHSDRFMKELGLEKGDVTYKNGKVSVMTYEQYEAATKEEKASDDRVKSAIAEFVDTAILRPSPSQRPAWASDPHFAILFHLKSFMYSFQKTILNPIYREAKLGNYAPMLALSAYLPAGIMVGMVKDIIKTAGDDDDDFTPTYKDNWSWGDYVIDGAEKSGLTGIAQPLFDMNRNTEYGGSALGGLVSPAMDMDTFTSPPVPLGYYMK